LTVTGETPQGADGQSSRQGSADEASREELIVELWAKGLSYRAIGRELGMLDRSVAGLISRLRSQGWDLPPRR
jgi:DNA-binding NarL/FixJ family response regulator